MTVKYLFLFSLLLSQGVFSQSLKITELIALLDMAPSAVDSLLQQKGYALEEREGDSAMQLHYYTSLEPHAEEPTWVRSVSLFDVSDGSRSGRMLQYRTYHGADQDELLSWLLQNQYTTVDRFAFDEEQHAIYTNGHQRILVKTGWGRLPNKKIVPYYVWEIGR